MSTAPGSDARDLPQDILDTPHATQAVVRGGVWRVLAFLVSNGLAVLSAAVIVRYLGVVDLGRYTTVVALTTLIGGLFEAGLGNLGVREAAVLHGAARDSFLKRLLGLRLIVATLALFASVAAAAILGYSSLIVVGTAVASVGGFAYTLQSHYATVLQLDLELGRFSFLDFVRQVAFTAFAILFVVLNLGIVALLAVPAPAHLVVLAVTLWFVRGRIPLGFTFDLHGWRPLLEKSLPVAMTVGVGVVYSYLTILLLSQLGTEQETGIFSASFRVYGVVAAVPGLLVGSLLPILSRANRDDVERLRGGLQRTFEVSVLIGAGLGLLTVVGAPVAIAVVAGPAFDASVPVLQIQGVAVLMTSAVVVGGFALLGMGAYRASLWCNVVGLAVVAAVTAALVGPLGAEGAAVANVVGDFALAAAFLFAVRRRGVSVRWRIPVLAVTIAAALTAAALVVGLPPLVEALAAAALFAGMAWAVGIVPQEVIDSLRPSRGTPPDPA